MSEDKQHQYASYKKYEICMRKRIDELIEQLNNFNSEEKNTGKQIVQCSKICRLIMDLGSGMTPALKSFFNFQIPQQNYLLEELLDKVEVQKLDVVFLVCIIRTTSQAKNNLKNWHSLRDRIYDHIETLGEDAKSIMRGLYSN